jgi:inosine/xanthosine triphosphate pyrophosphatase family protein
MRTSLTVKQTPDMIHTFSGRMHGQNAKKSRDTVGGFQFDILPG